MARNRIAVPTAPGRSVQVQPLDLPRLRYAESRNVVGESVERLGEAASGLAGGLQDLAIRKAEYSAKDGALAFGEKQQQRLYNPEGGLYTLQGKAAVDGYEAVLEGLKKDAAEISASLPSPMARRLFDDSAAATMQMTRKQIGAFVVRERQVWENEVDTSMVSTEYSSAGRAWDDDEASEVHLATGASIIARMANRGRSLEWAQDQIEQRESAARRDIGIARVTNIGPDAGEAYFKRFEKTFSADDARAVQGAIRVRREAIAADERRVAAEQRAAAAAARAERREELATLRSQLDTGAGSSADYLALAEGYSAIGDTSAAAEARAKAGERKAAEGYRGASLSTLDTEIAALEAREGKLSPNQASTLTGLRTLREQTASRLNEPGGALRQEQYASGRPVAALDLADPASFQARANSAVAAARNQGGRVEPLFADDIRRLEGSMQGEASERLKVLRTIAQFRDPRAIEGAARQLTGEGDGDFRIAATLVSSPGGEKLALEVLRGRDALATSEKAFNGGLAQFEFNRSAAPALSGMPPDYSRDVFDGAKAIYAERSRQKGSTAWDAALWRSSVNAALGGNERGGGIVRRGDKYVSLPPGWTGEQLFSRIAAMPTQKVAKGGEPIWPDGSQVTIGQIRALTPVRVGGTVYGFQTRAGRLLGTKGGRPYLIDASKLPRAK